jgi:hypothetical protein
MGSHADDLCCLPCMKLHPNLTQPQGRWHNIILQSVCLLSYCATCRQLAVIHNLRIVLKRFVHPFDAPAHLLSDVQSGRFTYCNMVVEC